MIRVALIGAQDAGKTTLARLLTGLFSAEGYLTYHVAEYCRDYLQKSKASTPPTLPEELNIIHEQIKREKEVPKEVQLVVTDSPICLAYIYGLLQCPLGVPPDMRSLIHLEKIYDRIWSAWNYDLVFYLVPMGKPRVDGVRPQLLISQNEDVDIMIQGFLDLHRVPYTALASTTFDRSEMMRMYIELIAPRIRSTLAEAGYVPRG
jgi:nicotinamide riboside kinase